MIKKYEFNYDFFSASAVLEVDTEKFTKEMAKDALEFFSWDYDEDADPINEAMNKYAIEAIKVATFENKNSYGVMCAFDVKEGFCPVNGKFGIKLISCTAYDFLEDSLQVEIEENAKPSKLAAPPVF